MINVVILAAGQGKRMRSSLPKVLQPLAGMPMLGHVLASVRKLENVSRTVVVVGCGAEVVKSAFAQEEGLHFVLQEPQMGTGHALQCALPELDSEAEYTLVLLGDVPLVQPETIERLLTAAGDGMAILTTVLRNPTAVSCARRAALLRLSNKRTPPKAKSKSVKLTPASCCFRRRACRGGFPNSRLPMHKASTISPT